MSFSPPNRRLSNASSIVSADSAVRKHEEELINSYEAEEERIVNVLSRKLEKLREDKVDLENTLEAESESHVNRLSRELGALRVANQQLQQQLHQAQQTPLEVAQRNVSPTYPITGHSRASSTGSMLLDSAGSSPPVSLSTSPDARLGYRAFILGKVPAEPNYEMMLETMRRENDDLRNRLVDTERDYIRISKLNERYREELIEHRRRLGLSVDNLIGLTAEPLSQPTHHHSTSSSASSSPAAHAFYSNTSSPSASVFHIPTSYASRQNHSIGIPIPSTSYFHRNQFQNGAPASSTHSVPIPRPGSQVHRPKHLPLSSIEDGSNPSSASMDSGSSFPFSPESSASASFVNPASYVSASTNVTSPPSSFALAMPTFAVPQRNLSYPTVPPPSLSSSVGSTVSAFQRDASLSPVEPLSRRNSNAGRRGSVTGVGGRVAETGSLRNLSHNNSAAGSRRASFDRGSMPIGGGRVAEMGTLGVGRRSRAGSLNQGQGGQQGSGLGGFLPETVAEADDTDLDGMEMGIPDANVDDTAELTSLASVTSLINLAALKKDGPAPEIPPAKTR